jgi:hypothetical protein
MTELGDVCKPQTGLAVRTNRQCGWNNHPVAIFVVFAVIMAHFSRRVQQDS